MNSSNSEVQNANGNWSDAQGLDFEVEMFGFDKFLTQRSFQSGMPSALGTSGTDYYLKGDFFGSNGNTFAGTFSFTNDGKSYMGAHVSKR